MSQSLPAGARLGRYEIRSHLGVNGMGEVYPELKELPQGHNVSPHSVSVIYVGLGDKEQASQWLENANDERNCRADFPQS